MGRVKECFERVKGGQYGIEAAASSASTRFSTWRKQSRKVAAYVRSPFQIGNYSTISLHCKIVARRCIIALNPWHKMYNTSRVFIFLIDLNLFQSRLILFYMINLSFTLPLLKEDPTLILVSNSFIHPFENNGVIIMDAIGTKSLQDTVTWSCTDKHYRYSSSERVTSTIIWC